MNFVLRFEFFNGFGIVGAVLVILVYAVAFAKCLILMYICICSILFAHLLIYNFTEVFTSYAPSNEKILCGIRLPLRV